MKVKFFISAVMLLVATSASAQFQTGSSSSAATASNEEDYNAIYFQYNPQTMYFDDEDESGANGYLLGFVHGTQLSNQYPVYIESGLAFQYAKYDDNGTEMSFTDLRVPVNFSYRYQVPNSMFTIAPYVGLTAKINFSGKLEVDGYSGSVSFFDKDDMGESKYTANRFQLAWQIGVNADINKIRLGIGYGKDLTEYMDCPGLFPEMKFGSLNLTLGVRF